MKYKSTKSRKVFTNPETKLGFNYVLWGSKHFGFYPTGKADITEKEAQILYQDLVAENLQLKEEQIVLDAGCGQGIVSTYLAKKLDQMFLVLLLFHLKSRKHKSERKN